MIKYVHEYTYTYIKYVHMYSNYIHAYIRYTQIFTLQEFPDISKIEYMYGKKRKKSKKDGEGRVRTKKGNRR